MKTKMIKYIEEKLEIEKYRRENALLMSMNTFQQKINTYLVQKEKKEKKRKEAILEAEKEKEEKKLSKNNNLIRVQKNIKAKEKEKEQLRLKLLEEIEKKNLKAYAIKQEKNKIYEEKRKMNIENQKERQALKIKIENIIKNEQNINEGKKAEDLINQLLDQNENNQS